MICINKICIYIYIYTYIHIYTYDMYKYNMSFGRLLGGIFQKNLMKQVQTNQCLKHGVALSKHLALPDGKQQALPVLPPE